MYMVSGLATWYWIIKWSSQQSLVVCNSCIGLGTHETSTFHVIMCIGVVIGLEAYPARGMNIIPGTGNEANYPGLVTTWIFKVNVFPPFS